MIGSRSGDTSAAAADGTAGPAMAGVPIRRVTAVMLLAAAALDLTRCGLAAGTVTPPGPAAGLMTAAGLVTAGLGAAAVSLWTARGCQRGARWSGWAAFLIGTASGPQAAASGFRAAYLLPDTATAALGVLVAAAVLATAGRARRPGPTAPPAAPDGPVPVTRTIRHHEPGRPTAPRPWATPPAV